MLTRLVLFFLVGPNFKYQNKLLLARKYVSGDDDCDQLTEQSSWLFQTWSHSCGLSVITKCPNLQ